MKKIGIVGSINIDMTTKTNTIPVVGETVSGVDFFTSFGGKGANEAVAVSRLGAKSILFGALGDDTFSKNALYHLKQEKVDVSAIKTCPKTTCGIANIILQNGNNSIIVCAGANAKVNSEYITTVEEYIKTCEIIGTQLEISSDAVYTLSELCKKNNVKLVFNPSPIKPYNKKIFDNATFVIVNEIEITKLDGYNEKEPDEILKLYPNKLIVTRGSLGSYFYDGHKIVFTPSLKVKVLDTTGAGDTFLGAFMMGIVSKKSIHESIKYATICAGIKVTKLGAQTGMPTKSEVEVYIKEHNIKL